jgi:hypothetical protein
MDITWKRLFAQLADSLIYTFLSFVTLIIVCVGVGLLVMVLTGNDPKITSTASALAGLAGFFGGYIFWNYRHLKRWDATLGYKLFGIRLEPKGNKNYFWRVIAKMFVGLFVLSISILGLVHLLLLFSSKGEKGLLDQLVGTRAVLA